VANQYPEVVFVARAPLEYASIYRLIRMSIGKMMSEPRYPALSGFERGGNVHLYPARTLALRQMQNAREGQQAQMVDILSKLPNDKVTITGHGERAVAPKVASERGSLPPSTYRDLGATLTPYYRVESSLNESNEAKPQRLETTSIDGNSDGKGQAITISSEVSGNAGTPGLNASSVPVLTKGLPAVEQVNENTSTEASITPQAPQSRGSGEVLPPSSFKTLNDTLGPYFITGPSGGEGKIASRV